MVACFDGFETSRFDRETHGCVEVADKGTKTGEVSGVEGC